METIIKSFTIELNENSRKRVFKTDDFCFCENGETFSFSPKNGSFIQMPYYPIDMCKEITFFKLLRSTASNEEKCVLLYSNPEQLKKMTENEISCYAEKRNSEKAIEEIVKKMEVNIREYQLNNFEIKNEIPEYIKLISITDETNEDDAQSLNSRSSRPRKKINKVNLYKTLK